MTAGQSDGGDVVLGFRVPAQWRSPGDPVSIHCAPFTPAVEMTYRRGNGTLEVVRYLGIDHFDLLLALKQTSYAGARALVLDRVNMKRSFTEPRMAAQASDLIDCRTDEVPEDPVDFNRWIERQIQNRQALRSALAEQPEALFG